MTFFENQVAAKRKTYLLIGYFVLAVLLIIISIYAATFILFINATTSELLATETVTWWDPDLFGMVAGATLIIVFLGSVYKIVALSGGGAKIAEYLGGTLVLPNTQDAQERKVLNVVEEVAIASGMPVPPVYILHHEMGINAFAAGFTVDNAVIGVTKGCINTLSRDELQGVIAHEFSHILNGDMRLNIRLMGILHGILIIGITGYWLFRSSYYSSHGRYRSRDRDSSGGIVLFGLALYLIGYIGVFFGNLIKAAVSRQREFLADASAVQFTRNPSGIAGALKKIGGLVHGSNVSNPNSAETSHFFFANRIANAFFDLLSTHPPLVDRIKKIDPSFDGEFKFYSEDYKVKESAAAQVAGLSQFDGGSTYIPLKADEIAEKVGAPQAEHFPYAASLLAAIPKPVISNAHDAYGARVILYALLLDANDTIKQKQLKHLSETEDKNTYHLTLKIAPEVQKLSAHFRLPLVDLCIPALRLLSKEQYKLFRSNLHFLANADQKVSIFEYALHHILLRHVDIQFKTGTAKKRTKANFKQLREAGIDLLKGLALTGHEELGERKTAFKNAIDIFSPGTELDIDFSKEASLNTLDQSLMILAVAPELQKQKILEAATACVTADDKVTIEEAELLRTIGDALECPIPPFLPN